MKKNMSWYINFFYITCLERMSDLEKFSSDSAMVSFFFAKSLSKLITFSTPFIIKDNMFNDISRRCMISSLFIKIYFEIMKIQLTWNYKSFVWTTCNKTPRHFILCFNYPIEYLINLYTISMISITIHSHCYTISQFTFSHLQSHVFLSP